MNFYSSVKGDHMIKYALFYTCTRLTVTDINSIYADMIGVIGGDQCDIEIEDIYFDDDCTCQVICAIDPVQLDEGCTDKASVVQRMCQTLEEADQNLHKFLIRYQEARVMDHKQVA